MTGSDNTPELRARLRPTPDWDHNRKLIHDFRNMLTDLCFSVQLEDRDRMATFVAELTKLYSEASCK